MTLSPASTSRVARASDPILLPLLTAQNPTDSARAVERLLEQFADPIIEAAVYRHLAGAPSFVRGEAVEVRAETVYRLLTRLDASGEAQPIRDFRAYVKTTASRVCWNRQQNALRHTPVAALASCLDDGDEETNLMERLPASGSVHGKAERSRMVQAVWKEITTLPYIQRLALLLNVRVSDGRSGVYALLNEGDVSSSDVAAALHLSAVAFADLVEQLPLDDVAIGALTGRTAHQVGNLRIAARRRIARRLREWMD